MANSPIERGPKLAMVYIFTGTEVGGGDEVGDRKQFYYRITTGNSLIQEVESWNPIAGISLGLVLFVCLS